MTQVELLNPSHLSPLSKVLSATQTRYSMMPVGGAPLWVTEGSPEIVGLQDEWKHDVVFSNSRFDFEVIISGMMGVHRGLEGVVRSVLGLVKGW